MIVGEYNPVFGIIKLEGDYRVIENEGVDKQASYVHERIHFVQNYTTLYGVNKSIFLLSDMLDCINRIKAKQPVRARNDIEDFVVTTYEILMGDDGQKENCFISNVDLVNEEKEYYSEEFAEQIEYLEETVLISLECGKTYRFGGAAICESMAYLVENMVFFSNDYENRLPYNACEMLYEFVVGRPCKNKAALFAVAHLALMNKAPGKNFYQYLQHIKKLDYDITIEDVYLHFYNEIHIPNKTNLEQLFERIDMIMPTDFDEISGSEMFAGHREKVLYANQWLKDCYNNLIQKEENLRKELWAILEIESENVYIKRKLLFELLDQYGNSIVIDQQGRLYDEDDSKLMLLAPICLYNTIFNNKKECYLYKTCLQYGVQSNFTCFDEWWNYKPDNTVCLMQFYLYIMGLQEIDFDEIMKLKV